MNRTRLAEMCVLLLACGGGDGATPSGVTATSSVTNIAGVLHVDLPALPPAGAAQIGTEETFTTSGRTELFWVMAGRLLEGGRVAVANAGTREILILAGDGDVERRMGGDGEGPGEFRWISSLDVDSAGGIVAYDPRLGRLTRVTADGDPESLRFTPPNRVVDILPLATLADGRIAAVYGEVRVFQASGEARDTIPLMLFDAEGQSVDTLGLWPATEWAFISIPGGSSRAEVGFGGKAVYAGRNGRFAIGSTDTLDISVFGNDGQLVMRIGGGGGRADVQPADVERWRQALIESRRQAPPEVQRGLQDVPYREWYPAFDGLALDDRGRIWIGCSARPGDAERTWVLVEPDGSIAGVVLLPGSARILDIAHDRIALLGRNELDEEYVSVRALGR